MEVSSNYRKPLRCSLGAHKWVVSASEFIPGLLCRGCGATRNPSRSPWYLRLACGVFGHRMEGWPTDGGGFYPKQRLGCGRCAAMFEKKDRR